MQERHGYRIMKYEYSTRRYRNWYAKLLRFYPKPYHERFGEGTDKKLLKQWQDLKLGIFIGK